MRARKSNVTVIVVIVAALLVAVGLALLRSVPEKESGHEEGHGEHEHSSVLKGPQPIAGVNCRVSTRGESRSARIRPVV